MLNIYDPSLSYYSFLEPNMIPNLLCCISDVCVANSCRAWLKVNPSAGEWNTAVACIGETTALAAKKLGLQNVYYPLNPGLEG